MLPSVFPPSPSLEGEGRGGGGASAWSEHSGSDPEVSKSEGARAPSGRHPIIKPAAFRRPRRCSMQAEGAIHIRKRASGPTRLL